VTFACPRIGFRRFRALRGLKAPRRGIYLGRHDRPQANVYTRIAVGIVLVAALLTNEVQAFPVGCRDMTTRRATPGCVLGIDQLEPYTGGSGFVGQKELSLRVRPAVDFRPEVFPFTQRRVSDVAEVFADDVPCIVGDGIGNQLFTCSVEQGHRYGCFVTAHASEETPGGPSANGLDCTTFAADTGTAMVFHPALEKECAVIGRVGGDEHPLDAHVNPDNTAGGFYIRNLDFVREAQVPALSDAFQFGIFPTGFWDRRMVEGDWFSKDGDAFFVPTEIPAVSQLHGWFFVDNQVPPFKRFQGFVATSNLTEKRASQLRRELELLTNSSIEGTVETVRIEFFRLENLFGDPTGGGEIATGNLIEMSRFTNFYLDCTNGFQYILNINKLLIMSTLFAQPGQRRDELRRGNHSVSKLMAHLVFVVKYRHAVISESVWTSKENLMKVKITKLLASREAALPPGNWETFKAGADNPGVSMPVDYTIEGTLVNDIEIGEPVRVLRTKRNGIVVSGFFETSPVTKIGMEGFTTQNSVYRLELLD